MSWACPLLTLPAMLHSSLGPLFPEDYGTMHGLSLRASREIERNPQPASYCEGHATLCPILSTLRSGAVLIGTQLLSFSLCSHFNFFTPGFTVPA